jgi:Pre-SET motif/SET domain
VLPWLRPRGLVWCCVYALHAAPPAGVLATTNCHLTRQQRAELEQLAAATAGRCAVANYQLRRLIQSLWATFDCISSTAFVDRGRQKDFWIALQAEFMQCRSYTSMVASLLHVFDAFDPKLHLPAAAAWRAEAVGAMQRTSMRQVESLCSKLVFGIVEASLLCVSDDKWTASRKGLQRWNGQIIDWHAAPSPSADDNVDVKLWGKLKKEIDDNTGETLLIILPSSTGAPGGGGASPLALMPSIKSDSGGAAADGAAVQTVRRENHKRLRQTQTPPLQTATPPQGSTDIIDLVSPSQSDDDADAVMVTSEIGDAEHPIIVYDSGDDVDFDVTPSHPDIFKAARTGLQAVLQRRKAKNASLAQRNKARVSAPPPVSPPAEGHALGSGNKLAIVALPQGLPSTAALSSGGGLTASLQLIPVPPPPLRLPPPPERCLSDEQKAADHAARVLNAHVLCTDLSRLYKDGSGDLERVPIPVLAQDPNHQMPPKFTYITKRFNVEAVAPADWRAFSTDCNCHGCSCGEDCCHIKYRDAEFPNDKDYNGVPLRGRLPYLPGQHGVCLYHQDSDSYLHECSAHCPCDMSCPMRVLQRGVTRQLALMPAENRGWGVFAVEDIPKGAFIAEYVGKLITDEEAENVSVDEYLFDGASCLCDSKQQLTDNSSLCLQSTTAAGAGIRKRSALLSMLARRATSHAS